MLTLEPIALCFRRAARLGLAALILSSAAAAAQADAPPVLRALKGLNLGMPKAAALKAIEELRLGVPSACFETRVKEEICQAGVIPAAVGFTFARQPVHYLELTFYGGALQQIGLTMGTDSAPARDEVMGEIGETLAAATGANPQVYASTQSDVTLRWKDGQGELLLESTRLKRGVQVQVFLRDPARAPLAFTDRTRGHARFLSDL